MELYKLVFFVPNDAAEGVKEKIFETGAGAIGNYSKCSWECQGVGQFLPNGNANPTVGCSDVFEKVSELKVEILCSEVNIKSACEALFEAHPYEEPAYEIISIYNYDQIKTRLKD